jgi:two-component system OmpR family response regulator
MYHRISSPDFTPRQAMSVVPPTRIGRVLLIDEDLDVRRSILSFLANRQCTASACSALDFPRHLQNQPVSLVVVNARLGTSSGLDVLRQIRSRSHVPVILYRDGPQADVERIVGLELGADDFLCGPLNLDELLARARAILRRQELGRMVPAPLRGGHRFDGWELRHTTRRLTSPSGEAVSLTKKEYALLSALVEAPGRPLSRLHLMRATRMHEDIYDRSIDVQVLRLRRKLACDSSEKELIKTERGFGYKLDAQVEVIY